MPSGHDAGIETVRRFNRVYTREIGVLNREFLDSPYSLAEVRLLYELNYHAPATATAMRQELGLDAGYLSRILRRFGGQGLLTKERVAADARQTRLALSEKGRRTFKAIESRQRKNVAAMLEKLSPGDQRRLIESMLSIETLLGERATPSVPYIIRPPQSGDIGWIIHRQGLLYNQEYGWDERFEALVAEIAAKFFQSNDQKRERCWIAERDGEVIGCVLCVKDSKTIARLRLLYVEPSARGLGVGSRLVEECIAFARRARYRKVALWTQSVLHSARHIYERAGFHRVSEEPHHSFGHDLVGQTWELEL
jgi:DNA-binding MarR family transcriptional regulator/N-acetylglutamate synthase-like GNAT family acetyltransferase